MCGITGIAYLRGDKKVALKTLKTMTDVLAHRGPDGEGFYINNNVGLGHRRLSIIDLSTGDQPIYSRDKSLVLVFNGEIYNYVEIREDLKKLGHTFLTTSDSEVIIHAYEQWGLDCQKIFNGMWAFALWDNRNKSLFISRDRIGVKPLYYSVYNNTFSFASEIKSILSVFPGMKINLSVISLYLTLSYIPAPHSFYKNILKLEPGCCLLLKDGNYKVSRYWDLPDIDEQDLIKDKSSVYEQFDDLFRDSVKLRMRSDVPYGAFLSGGLDSTSTVAIMSELSSYPVETFTIGFKEKTFDESDLANEAAKKFSTHHHQGTVEHDSFLQSLEKVVNSYDEPFGDSSAIPTGYVSKFAVKHVKMVLTGDGGDECLSGYPGYQAEKIAYYYKKLPNIIRKKFPKSVGLISPYFKNDMRYMLNRMQRVVHTSNLHFPDRFLKKASYFDTDLLNDLFIKTDGIINPKDYISDFFIKTSLQEGFYQLNVFDLKISLPDRMLTKVDRMTMAYSLEARSPFLDYRLVELLFKVDMNVKMEGFERKTVLRNTIGKRLPRPILKAKKSGFGIPLREWMKESQFQKHFNKLKALEDFGFRYNTIKKMISENNGGQKDYGNHLWMLFVLNECLTNLKP
ncbi:MAG: asparagine synthase (glutamine-hydrolyzing) [Proteobacteria bacterium]|nr:asparagine synthase (glutamine-hydrolyzing) [Pseudomonadota bacterium]